MNLKLALKMKETRLKRLPKVLFLKLQSRKGKIRKTRSIFMY